MSDYVIYYTEGANIVENGLWCRFQNDNNSVKYAHSAKTFATDTASYASGLYRVGRQNKEIRKYYFLGKIKCVQDENFGENYGFVQTLFRYIE